MSGCTLYVEVPQSPRASVRVPFKNLFHWGDGFQVKKEVFKVVDSLTLRCDFGDGQNGCHSREFFLHSEGTVTSIVANRCGRKRMSTIEKEQKHKE